MQSSSTAKLTFVAASFVLVLLFEGITDRVFADANDGEAAGWVVQSSSHFDKCVDGEALDYSSCCIGQHCANGHAVVLSISIIIDPSGGIIAAYRPVPHLQVDKQPEFKPPRIS